MIDWSSDVCSSDLCRGQEFRRHDFLPGGAQQGGARIWACPGRHQSPGGGALLPIAHESTSQTGLLHVDGTVSMARNAPGTAMGDFFITIGKSSYLDAREGNVGYAAFGQVVEGLDVVRKILASPQHPGGRSEATTGQSIADPNTTITPRREPTTN